MTIAATCALARPELRSSPTDAEALAESIDNRLFFAGEATYAEHQATVHGAYLSGLRAAQEIYELV